MKNSFLFIFLLSANGLFAQTDNPFIRLVNPVKENNAVSSSRQFIIGSTCKTCTVTINGKQAKVWSTGAIAYELNLVSGDTNFIITAAAPSGKATTKTISYSYAPPKPATPVTMPSVESIQTFPEGNLVLAVGDRIRFRVKALPGADLQTINDTKLYELPVSQTHGMAGIYQGEYIVKETDHFSALKFSVNGTAPDGQKFSKETGNSFSVISPLSSDVCITTGRLAHLEYGLGEDRLGGAKIGYIDSLIPLKIIGKVGEHYKVLLAPDRTAYIPEDVVTLMPKGSFAGEALTDRWEVYGDSSFDYVAVGLTAKLPYQSMQEPDPARIVVDIFGAVNNTNWISQLQTVKEIANVDYEQVSDGVFRVIIYLRHHQPWGYDLYYSGSRLVIRVKHAPRNLSLRNMTVAVDAGHGGSNTGAGGPTGVAEKDLALAVSLKLQKALQNEGANVLMTRTTEKFVDNKERILIYRDNRPDLLVSIHLNSSGDPLHAGGTSTFYRYIGFRPLSDFIHRRMLELGLKDYGNNGSFNFMLNSPTEYPNALVETLFLSNPDEEALILDPAFQQKIADKIVAGIKDFLAEAAKDQ